MGRGASGGGMARSGGGMAHGGTSMGHGGVGHAGGRVGGNLGQRSFGGYGHGPAVTRASNNSNHQPQFRRQNSYYRTSPQDPWHHYGTLRSPQDAIQYRQFMQNHGFESFVR